MLDDQVYMYVQKIENVNIFCFALDTLYLFYIMKIVFFHYVTIATDFYDKI